MPVRSATGRPVAGSAAELVAGATHREPLLHTDGKSFVPMERVVIDGTSYVTKSVSPRFDWISRATGDYVARVLTCWRLGILDRLPDGIDHTIVAVAYEPDTLTTTLLMRDVGAHLVPEGSSAVPLEQHRRFLDDMAALHAAFWGTAHGLPELTPMSVRFTALSPMTTDVETALGTPSEVPAMLGPSWRRLDEAVPDAARLARSLASDPWPLISALAETPASFVHGDWKYGNLGTGPDGRTILIDWQWPGTAPVCSDIAWYVAVNADRIPESREQTFAAYREALERHGVPTDSWFDAQLELSLLGAFVQLGWNKVHDIEELNWWADRALAASRRLA
jgi:phosphotransferase family enzyme